MPKTAALQAQLEQCVLQYSNGDIWLGLSDTVDEGTFRWSDGSTLSQTGEPGPNAFDHSISSADDACVSSRVTGVADYSNWASGEPNNSGEEE